MKKLSIFIITVILLLSFVSVSQAVKNGTDEIAIRRPNDNSTISGIQELEWFMFDSDQENIPFQVDLFRKSCSESGSFIGTIADNNPPLDSEEGVYKYSWDTSTKVEGTTITDGNYCMRICGVFVQNSNNYYSLCDKRSVAILKGSDNTDSGVSITSSPSNLNVPVGGTFVYEVSAESDDGSQISYSLTKSHDFLEISNSGVISSTGPISELGSYEVTVRASNQSGGSDSQTFSINVIQSDNPYSLNFLEPTGESNFEGIASISWDLLDATNVKQIIVSYSSDQQNWNNIVSLEANVDDYSWDISEVTPGDYFLRITIRDEEDNDFFFVSEKFSIGGGGSNSIFTSVVPEENSQVGEVRPSIYLFFELAEATLVEETLVVNVDDNQEIIECNLFSETIECTMLEDLQLGNHEISISIEDTQGNSYSKEWTFELVDQVSADENGESIVILGRTISRNTFNIAIGVLCGGLLLLLIPWFLYYKIKNRKKDTPVTQQQQMQPPPEFTSMDPEPINVDEYQPVVTVAQPMADTTQQSDNLMASTQEFEAIDPIVPDQIDQTVKPQESTIPVEPEIITEAEPLAAPSNDSVSMPSETTSAGIHMPSSYTDEEIPDWLKDFESDQPISPSGQTTNEYDGDSNTDAKVHDSYGLSLNPDSGDEQV